MPETPGDSVDIDKVLHSDDVDEKVKRQLIIKGKVSTVAKITKMFATLREESEMLLQIKNISPDGKLPRGLLLQGKPAIKNGKQTSDLRPNLIITYSSQAILICEGDR